MRNICNRSQEIIKGNRKRETLYGKRTGFGRTLGNRRTFTTTTEDAPIQASRSQADRPAQSIHRNYLRTQEWHSVGDVTAGNRLRFRHELLAVSACLAGSGCLGENSGGVAGQAQRGGPDRLVEGGGGQRFGKSRFGGAQVGPNPTDRRKGGSKHHLITDAQGVPLAVILTPANTHDVTQLIPLVDAIPPVRGKRGRPRRKPDAVQGDRGYDSEPHRCTLRRLGITPIIAKRNTEHGSGLGVTRWVVERTISWLHQYRRLRVRYERRSDIHEAFLSIACSLICWNFLKASNSFC